MEKGLAIIRDASGNMLQCLEKPLDEKLFSTVFEFMDTARVDPDSNINCCEVWTYKGAASLSLLATFF